MKVVMRLSILTVLLVFAFSAVTYAQTDNTRRYYGGATDSGSGSVYVNPNTNYGSGGPISIPQLLRGETSSGAYSSGSSYGGAYYGGTNARPYGMDNNSYSLAITPAQVRERRAERDRQAQQLERDSQNQIEQASYSDTLENSTNQYLEQFQNRDAVGTRQQTPTQRRIYRQRDDGFEMPERVFRSVR